MRFEIKTLITVGLLACMLFILPESASAQQGKEIAYAYKKVNRRGNFITRWYYDITRTSISHKTELILYNDGTFFYEEYDTYCGNSYYSSEGTWTLEKSILNLSGEFEGEFFMVNKKLYASQEAIEDKEWYLKRS